MNTPTDHRFQWSVGFRRRGVSLLEMLLAMGLFVLLSSLTYTFYATTIRTRDRDTQLAQKLQLVRVVLQRMADDIRQTSVISADERVGIRGEAERIWISTLRVPGREVSHPRSRSIEPPPAEYDLVKIEYKIARHPEVLHDEGYPRSLGLARVEHRIPRPDSAETGEAFEDEQVTVSGGEASQDALDDALFEQEGEDIGLGAVEDIDWEQLYAKDVHYLRLCYFDGYQWWDDWDVPGDNPLPQLVQVTIGLEEHPPLDSDLGVRDPAAEEFCTCLNREPSDCLPLPEDQFTITVRLPQSDPFFRSRVGREVKSLTDQLGQSESEAEGGQ